MHYKNGRAARNGDKVVVFPPNGNPIIGVMYDSVPGNDYCNGKVAIISPSDPMVNLQEALHLDDVTALLPKNPRERTYPPYMLHEVPNQVAPVAVSAQAEFPQTLGFPDTMASLGQH